MREIKLRVWDKKKKEMYYQDKKMTTFSNERDRVGYKDIFLHFPKRYIKLLYTGLKDKNRKEIYEGDIVKNIFGELALVIYEAPNYKLDYKINDQKSNKKSIIWLDELKIIGNKYKNPELIKNER